jgi:indolepyruvate ferredoxin oxidoreductase beta subunit
MMSGPLRKLGLDPRRPITIAVLAMGGQGGGVLVDWIVDLAERNDYIAQSTSVPGVAQRTGATIYYIELFSRAEAEARGQTPVLALMPVPGEVDIVITSELMEAGRAMLRGLVTPDRTTLITSHHRDYATVEKVIPGNGVADADAVFESAIKYAKRFIHDDMQALARQSGSVISAVLFGALAGSGELPFDDAAFEETVTRAGVGVEASLRAFRAGAQSARQPIRTEAPADPMSTLPQPLPRRAASAAVEPLRARIERDFPVIEFQDVAYGSEYLDRMADLHAHALRCGDADHGHAAIIEAARWVAVAMAYDDVIRVADLKTRADRFDRVRQEIGAPAGEIVGTTEYFHPRLEEIYGLMPPGLVKWIDGSSVLRHQLVKRIGNGKRIRTHTVRGHLLLQMLAGLRRWRRRSLRHANETAHMQQWIDQAKTLMAVNYALGLELLSCRRLVKGYSDTHARGTSKFDRLLRAAVLLKGRQGAAQDLSTLRVAALADANGLELDNCWHRLGLPVEK